jgi:hypothetical protein
MRRLGDVGNKKKGQQTLKKKDHVRILTDLPCPTDLPRL